MLAILKLYGQLARKATVRAARGWPVILLPLLYPYPLRLIGGLLAPLGMLGGFIMAAIIALAISSYLFFLAEVVTGAKVRPSDLPRSFTAHFSDTMSVMVSLWIIGLGLTVLTKGMGPQGGIVRVLVGLTMVVFLNPIPEVIYQRRVAGGWFTHLGEAGRFVLAHWPAWLLPNLLLAAALLAPTGALTNASAGERLLLLGSVFSMDGILTLLAIVPLWLKLAMVLFLHWAMVWRGLLFEELSSGISTRQRAIRDAWGRGR